MLGPDHGQVDPLDTGEIRQGRNAVVIGLDALRKLPEARIPGRGINLLHPGALRELPNQGMFPAAGADDEDSQAITPHCKRDVKEPY